MIRWELRLDSCGEAKAGRWGLVHQVDERAKDTWKVWEGSFNGARAGKCGTQMAQMNAAIIQCCIQSGRAQFA